ncbi:hypothetical protein QOZ80_1AG0007570 [Eleusine coracana subsp. coracana]|nr:hypothetical protein QOZ80_1AG0007570 [Eleusine coracana subsp. coracana]
MFSSSSTTPRAASASAPCAARGVPPPPPWVVIPEEAGCSRSFTLISIPTQQGFRWTPPGGAGLRCVGSNGGWLAGAYIDADRTVRVSLVNPLTNARVDMPASGRVSFVPHNEHHQPEVERLLANAVQKVAFAPDPTAQSFFVAVVGVTRSRVPASFGIVFARAGKEKGWCAYAKIHDVDERSRRYYSAPRVDVAYHDGKFYYMTRGQLWVVDMAAPSPSPAPLAKFKPTLPSRVSDHDSYHLAFSGDGALHVVSSKTDGHSVCDFDMFAQRYDGPASHSPRGSSEWTSTTCLHGQCFLLGDFNQTLCVPTDGTAWLKPDSVYFASIMLCSLLAKYRVCRGGTDGVWQFKLDTGHIERPEYFQKLRFRPSLEFWRPAWSRHKDDMLEEEVWERLKSGLDWSKAIWFMPSMRSMA